jgi:hypothetical protein
MATNNLADSVILFTRPGLGDGEPALVDKRAVNDLRTLLGLGLVPRALAFFGDGFKRVVAGSPCVDELRRLQAAGARLIACRTCLDDDGLIDRVAAGEVGNMAVIVELQAGAGRVISV